MPKEKLYFLPGFLGSTLHDYDAKKNKFGSQIWLDKLEIVKCRYNDLAYENGKSKPGIRPKNYLSDYYRPMVKKLQILTKDHAQEGEKFWSDLTAIPYDWRDSVRANALALTESIDDDFASGGHETVSIVGHSMGALVAWEYWRIAKQAGVENRIRRLVSLGGPHYGSHDACRVLSGQEETIRGIAIVKTVKAGPLDFGQTQLKDAVKVAASWPGLYDLLPDPHHDTGKSEVKQFIYDSSSYPESFGVDQQQLGRALDWRLSNSDDSGDDYPPANVAVYVVGEGYRTRLGASKSALPKWEDKHFFFGAGDGTVSQNSAAAVGQPGVRKPYESLHADLCKHEGILRNMLSMLIEEVEEVEGLERWKDRRFPRQFPRAPGSVETPC